jgi:hypothetical protein
MAAGNGHYQLAFAVCQMIDERFKDKKGQMGPFFCWYEACTVASSGFHSMLIIAS